MELASGPRRAGTSRSNGLSYEVFWEVEDLRLVYVEFCHIWGSPVGSGDRMEVYFQCSVLRGVVAFVMGERGAIRGIRVSLYRVIFEVIFLLSTVMSFFSGGRRVVRGIIGRNGFVFVVYMRDSPTSVNGLAWFHS